MDRRTVLKGLGFSLGYLSTASTLVSLLQSCNTNTVKWVPQLLSKNEGVVLKNLIDLILPKTETAPGALEVNIPEFVDLFAAKVWSKNNQEELKKGIKNILKLLQYPVSKLATEDYDRLLKKYLRANKKEIEKFYHSEENRLVLNTLRKIRGISVWAYKTSQKVGEEVLAYDPIPGEQLGCVSLEETTGGKAWSL